VGNTFEGLPDLRKHVNNYHHCIMQHSDIFEQDLDLWATHLRGCQI